MKTTMSERGLSPLSFLGALILIGVMVILTIVFMNRGIGRGTSDIEGRFDTFADFDGDHVANFYDQCPCTDYGVTEHSQLRGCPPGTTASQSQENKRHFREENCPVAPTEATVMPTVQLTVTLDGYREIVALPGQLASGTTTSNQLGYSFLCSPECVLTITDPNNVATMATHEEAGSYLLSNLIDGTYIFKLHDTAFSEDASIEIQKNS